MVAPASVGIRGVAIALAAVSSARAFSFNIDTKSPKSCEDFTVSWSDAQAPFYLLLTPPFGVPRNFSLDDGQTSFTTQLPIAKSKKFVATMVDSTGKGVSSDVLTAGDSSSSCDTDDPKTGFEFELNSALQQCRPYVFSGYGEASKPVTAYGIIPLGDFITLHPNDNADYYEWTANAAEGTSIIFAMVDSQGRQGGASDTKLVGASDDSSCLNDSSPTTTATATASSGSDSGNKVSIGAIAGTVLGALVFLAAVVTLGLFWLRKRGGDRQPWEQKRRQSLAVLEVDPPSYDRHQGEFMPPGGQYDADPFVVPPPVTYQPRDSAVLSDSDHAAAQARSRTMSMNSGALSSSTSKGMQTPTTSRYAHSRFILHTDVEDVEPMPDAEGIIELPPQYTERRRRPSDANANSSTDLLGRNEKDGSYEMNTPSTAGGSGWPAPDGHGHH
ncbi:hypothetical protein FB107DRAFT_263130 [Schizophyllum commune]